MLSLQFCCFSLLYHISIFHTTNLPSALDFQLPTMLLTDRAGHPSICVSAQCGIDVLHTAKLGGSVLFLLGTRRGKTATKWDEQEVLGQISFSRKQKRRKSSVFYCAKERQRFQFWLAKSEWHRADNLRYIFPIKYLSCRYWEEIENSQPMNSTINCSETMFLIFHISFVDSWTFVL